MYSVSESDKEYRIELIKVLINLPRPRSYCDRFNPLKQYVDFDFT